jgi:hypothetical protein
MKTEDYTKLLKIFKESESRFRKAIAKDLAKANSDAGGFEDGTMAEDALEIKILTEMLKICIKEKR